jgi:FimV-like protein
MKNTFQTIRLSILVSALSIVLCTSGAAMAEGKTWEIKPNDTLGIVVAKQYAGYANRSAIMQAILKASPDAFIGNNLNRLIIGKVLTLPDASTIPDLKPPAPPVVVGAADKATLERIKALEADRVEMEETLKLLEEENASLQEMVKTYEETKQSKDAELAKLNDKVKELEAAVAAAGKTTPAAADGSGGDLAALKSSADSLTAENAELKSQLESSKQALADNQRVTQELEAQLTDLKNQNEALSNEVQQAHAAASVAESKSSSGNWWSWLLLGLMAALMLPLLWLLKRNREEPLVTTVAAPVKAEPATQAFTAPTSVTSETRADTVRPPMPVMPTVAEAKESVPEDPDTELKLDIARAYLDLRDSAAAADILKEVILEGGERQKQEAREILSFIA